MKKAKIVLSAIAVLGVLGSTFAFKAAKRFTNGHLLYITTVANATAVQTLARGITAAVGNAAASYRWYTAIKGDKAPFYSKLTVDL